jgi:hypothetical protein
MDRAVLENLLAGIDCAAFATIDATTKPDPTVTKITTGRRVILFTNKFGSGYEATVRRRLIEAGKNPNNFELRDLKWGTRVPDTPLIEHKGKTYLQCVELTEGASKYYFLGAEADPANLNLRERHRSDQGLSPEEEVRVCAYDIANIDHLAVLSGDTLIGANGGTILPLVPASIV